MFSEFHRPLGSTAAAMLPKQAGELSENILQNIRNKLLPQTVSHFISRPFYDIRIRSHDIKEERMANILRYIERELGREVHLERDGMGRWAIPQELVSSSRIPFDQ